MKAFGRAALRAVELIKKCDIKPPEAWDLAISEMTPQKSVREKGCPRSAFLGLCEEGLVICVEKKPRGTYTKSVLNKQHAIDAIHYLIHRPDSCNEPNKIWKEIAGNKKHNSQMDVVCSLWKFGLIDK
ncbi:MAG: hypothetical protein AB7D00_10095 [Rhodospirillaceae bacterium]